MKELQDLANTFCIDFGLMTVTIPFTIAFSREDLRIYGMLTCPQEEAPEVKALEKYQKQLLGGTLTRERVAAFKDMLWKEVVANPKLSSFMSRFQLRDIANLEAAITICKSGVLDPKQELKIARKFVSGEQIEEALEIARRIRLFHVRGRVIKEFNELFNRIKKAAEKGKMPLAEYSSKDFEEYFHECIHYILFENKLYTHYNPFDEGLCTFLHIRFRGGLKTWSMYRPFSGSHHYMKWAPYFFEKFKRIPNGMIGPHLRKFFKIYFRQFRVYFAKLKKV